MYRFVGLTLRLYPITGGLAACAAIMSLLCQQMPRADLLDHSLTLFIHGFLLAVKGPRAHVHLQRYPVIVHVPPAQLREHLGLRV